MDYKEAIILLIIVKKAFLGSTEGDSYQEVAHKKIVEAIDLAIEALDNEPKKCEEITEEKAIDFLRHTGWLYEHDKVLTMPFGGDANDK